MSYRPPMFSKKIATAVNPDAAKGNLHVLGYKGAKDTELDGGICAAMCLLWFKKIFQSQNMNVGWQLRDDTAAAKTIFLQYMMTQRTGSALDKEVELYANHGMKMFADKSAGTDYCYTGNLRENGGVGAADWIRKTPELSCFSIGVRGHAMAGFWKKGAAFFFDPNEGVFEMSNINDFADEVTDSIFFNYFADPDDKNIFLYKVEKAA